MVRMMAALAVLGIAMTGCGGSAEPEKAGSTGMSAPKATAKATYICHMGADCGKADVAAGDKIPSCCGKVMVKAETFTCGSCGKSKICETGKGSPECCGAAMKKAAAP